MFSGKYPLKNKGLDPELWEIIWPGSSIVLLRQHLWKMTIKVQTKKTIAIMMRKNSQISSLSDDARLSRMSGLALDDKERKSSWFIWKFWRNRLKRTSWILFITNSNSSFDFGQIEITKIIEITVNKKLRDLFSK